MPQSTTRAMTPQSPQRISAGQGWRPIAHDGIQAYCSAYACDPVTRNVVYLSLIGFRTSVRALWAALVDGSYLTYGEGYFSKWLRRMDDATYRSKLALLPENNAAHLGVIANPATRFLERGQPFFVLQEKGEPQERVIQRFGALLDLSVGAPLLPHWSEALWHAGRQHKLVIPAEKEDRAGIDALWRVDVDAERWLDLIQKAIASRSLTVHLHCTERPGSRDLRSPGSRDSEVQV